MYLNVFVYKYIDEFDKKKMIIPIKADKFPNV